MSDQTKLDQTKAMFQGALKMFNSPASKPSSANVTDSKMESNPEDIPKEDLLHLMMKMNKRMQLMETKGQDLVRNYHDSGI